MDVVCTCGQEKKVVKCALEVLLVYTQLFGNTGHWFSVVYGKDAIIKIHFDKREGMNLLHETFRCF